MTHQLEWRVPVSRNGKAHAFRTEWTFTSLCGHSFVCGSVKVSRALQGHNLCAQCLRAIKKVPCKRQSK